ncbi:MAG: RNA-binding cell elongation regulator Jag/EloR [Anaerolineae bacterium]
MDERSRDARQSTEQGDSSSGSAEYSGKNVREALRRAAEELGVAPVELDYEVIRDTTRSVFGLVRTGEAVIRVWRRSTGRDVRPIERQPSAAMVEPDEAEDVLEAGDLDIPVEDLADEADVYVPDVQAVAGVPEASATAGARRAKAPTSDLERAATDVVATLLDKMGLIAAVEVVDRGGAMDPATQEPSPMVLNIVGDDLGLLIGRRGETLRDLQFIVRLILSRKLGAWPNLVLDVENYKSRRVSALRVLAERMADQVRRSGQPVALEPMPAHERRIIHLALRDDPDVYTESTGEDEARKIQILPKA